MLNILCPQANLLGNLFDIVAHSKVSLVHISQVSYAYFSFPLGICSDMAQLFKQGNHFWISYFIMLIGDVECFSILTFCASKWVATYLSRYYGTEGRKSRGRNFLWKTLLSGWFSLQVTSHLTVFYPINHLITYVTRCLEVGVSGVGQPLNMAKPLAQSHWWACLPIIAT